MNMLPLAKIRNNQKGQTLLLVLLSMAVILTIILSILSRSITDITITSKEEEALRAFSAAEAGIERAHLTGIFTPGAFEGSSFSGSVTNLAQAQASFVYPDELVSGDSSTVWFIDHDPTTGELTCTTGNCFRGSSMKVCWGKEGTNPSGATTPALEVSILYDTTPAPSGDYSDVKIKRLALDPNSGRRGTNKFSAATGACTVSGKSFVFSTNVDFTGGGLNIPCYSTAGCLLTAKLRLLYNSQTQPVAVEVTGGILPSQGLIVESTGVAGEATRKVQVFQTFGEPPPIFDSAVFSPGGLVK